MFRAYRGKQLPDAEVLLVRQMRRNDRAEGAAAVTILELRDRRGRALERHIPVRLLELAVLRDHRRAQPFGVADEVIVKPSRVAHPGVVDRVITPRSEPPDTVAVLAYHDVAAVRASRAYARGLRQKPYADLVIEVLCFERADRADVRRTHRIVVVEAAVANVEHRAVAQVEDEEFAGLADLAAEADASAAQDAAFLVEQHPLADIEPLAMLAPRFQRTRVVAAEAHREILQPAFARLVADRAVEWMVDQEQLEHAAAR